MITVMLGKGTSVKGIFSYEGKISPHMLTLPEGSECYSYLYVYFPLCLHGVNIHIYVCMVYTHTYLHIHARVYTYIHTRISIKEQRA